MLSYVSPFPENTIIGKNDWFFVSQKEVEIFKGNKDFNETQLTKLKGEWAYRKEYLENLNILSQPLSVLAAIQSKLLKELSKE